MCVYRGGIRLRGREKKIEEKRRKEEEIRDVTY